MLMEYQCPCSGLLLSGEKQKTYSLTNTMDDDEPGAFGYGSCR